jgi:alpha-tubulin suppressor-like RCC1 family protein
MQQNQPKTQPVTIVESPTRSKKSPARATIRPNDHPTRISLAVILLIVVALLGVGAGVYFWSGHSSGSWTPPDPQPAVAEGTKGALYAWGDPGFEVDGSAPYTYHVDNFTVAWLSNVVAMAAGSFAALAVDADGQAWSWGYNFDGRLGVGSSDYMLHVSYPVPIPKLTNVSDVAMGLRSAFALKTDGTVWAWGFNGNCQSGSRAFENKNSPVKVSGLSEVKQIAVSTNFALALKTDGTVWGWGAGYYIGQDSVSDICTPVKIDSLSNVTSIAAGDSSGYAVRDDGTVMAWGFPEEGSLGTGSNSYSQTPTPVLISDVSSVSVGYEHVLALKRDGTVWAWGNNLFGRLGDGTTDDALTPLQVVGVSDIKAVTAGNRTSYALDAHGNVWVWGDNYYVEYGDSAMPNSLTAIQVTRFHNVVCLAASKSPSSYYAMAIQG